MVGNAKSVSYLCQQSPGHFLHTKSVEAKDDHNTIIRITIFQVNVLFPIILKLYS